MPHKDSAGEVAFSELECQDYMDQYQVKELAELALNEAIKHGIENGVAPVRHMSEVLAVKAGPTENEKKVQAFHAAWSSGKLTAEGKEALWDQMFEPDGTIRHASKFESRKGLSVWSDAKGRDQCLAFVAKHGPSEPALVSMSGDGIRYVKELEAGIVLVKKVVTYKCLATGKVADNVVSMEEWTFGSSGKIAQCIDSHHYSPKLDAIFDAD